MIWEKINATEQEYEKSFQQVQIMKKEINKTVTLLTK